MLISISRNGVEIGTWPKDDVLNFYRQGTLLSSDLFWSEGMPDWLPLASMVKPPPPTAADRNTARNQRLEGPRFVINAMLLVLVMVVCGVVEFFLGEHAQKLNDENDKIANDISKVGARPMSRRFQVLTFLTFKSHNSLSRESITKLCVF